MVYTWSVILRNKCSNNSDELLRLGSKTSAFKEQLSTETRTKEQKSRTAFTTIIYCPARNTFRFTISAEAPAKASGQAYLFNDARDSDQILETERVQSLVRGELGKLTHFEGCLVAVEGTAVAAHGAEFPGETGHPSSLLAVPRRRQSRLESKSKHAVVYVHLVDHVEHLTPQGLFRGRKNHKAYQIPHCVLAAKEKIEAWTRPFMYLMFHV